MSYTPPSPYDQWGADKAAALFAATRMLGQVGVPAEVHVGAVVVDAHRLRAYGAKLDGITDDAAAVQAAITDAVNHCPAMVYRPSLVIELPAGTALALASTVHSGAVDIMLRGAGPNICEIRWIGGAGTMWEHGTVTVPSNGYFHAQGLSFVDANANGSGAVGLSVYLGPAVAQKCFSLEACAFRKWTTPIRMTNLVRGYSATNVTVFGPDNTFQPGAGFEIAADAACTQGSFDGRFVNVMVANYAWGWRYGVAQALEGQVFLGCNAYNGWGLCQVNVTAGGGYKSLLWSFVDCDWQGLGFGLDMAKCRQVTVRGGYWIANPNTLNLPFPTAALRVRYMTFKACENVRIQDVEMDVSPGFSSALALIHFDATCFDAQVSGSIVRSFSAIYAGVEIEPNAYSDVICERGTTWQVWAGGPKVLDGGANQACETIAAGAVWPASQAGVVTLGAAATTTGIGSYAIDGITGAITVDANGYAAVSFPTRPGGGAFFLGGPPVLTVSAVNSLAAVPAPSISSISVSGFVLRFPLSNAGLVLSISYHAKGI